MTAQELVKQLTEKTADGYFRPISRKQADWLHALVKRAGLNCKVTSNTSQFCFEDGGTVYYVTIMHCAEFRHSEYTIGLSCERYDYSILTEVGLDQVRRGVYGKVGVAA